MTDGTISNIPQGDDTTYMNGPLKDIEQNLNLHLASLRAKRRTHINMIKHIEGHIA